MAQIGYWTLKEPIQVLIVDDQAVVREGFRRVLRGVPGLIVVGATPGGEEALRLLKHRGIHVLLLDLHMPGMSGIETLLASQELPCPPRTIVLSSLEPDVEVCRAVEMGAKGYLRKDISRDEIVEAICAVCAGGFYLPHWLKARISERTRGSSLSPRELEILVMVSKGLTNKEIARVIRVSHFTVRNHVRHIIAKLEVGGRTEAATVAIQQGILLAHESSPQSQYAGEPQVGQPEGAPSWLTLRSDSRGIDPGSLR